MIASSHEIFLSLGSNLEPEVNFVQALELLKHHVTLTALSTCYRTEPIGPDGMGTQSANTPWFINAVLCGVVGMDVKALKFDVLRAIELALGRRRTADTYAPRTIDIDILLYGNLVVHDHELQLPDPHILERPFLVAGLLELAPGLVMPDSARMLRNHAAVSSVDMACRMRTMVPMQSLTQKLRERFFSHEH